MNESEWELITTGLIDDESFAADYLKIKTKGMAVEPFKLNMAQRHFCDHRTGNDIILKARQLGFSTLIQARLFRINYTQTSNCLTISDIDKNTQKLRAIYQRFYDKWDEELLSKPIRKKDSAGLVTYPESDSEMECVTAGSETGGRGGTVSHFHGSEVAFWKNTELVVSAALQALTPDGEQYWESTANGAQGAFYQWAMEALDGNSDKYLHFYPWWWEPAYRLPLDEGEIITPTDDEEEAILKAHQGGFDLKPEQIKWRRKKRRELPHTFLQEYPEDPRSCFLLSGSSYFGDTSQCFGADMDAQPSGDMTFDAGLDFGQANDYTVLSIGCRNTRQQVDVLRIRQLPWAEMRRQIIAKCQQWQIKRLNAEVNSIGGVNFEELKHEIEGSTTTLIPFTTTAKTKPGLVQSLYSALHEQGLSLQPHDFQKREIAAFQAKQSPHSMNWSYEAASGEHDDSVIAAGLMWLAMTRPDIAQIGYLD